MRHYVIEISLSNATCRDCGTIGEAVKRYTVWAANPTAAKNKAFRMAKHALKIVWVPYDPEQDKHDPLAL
jgi:hypothetical protein